MGKIDVAGARQLLTGPIHGTLQTVRGMCTDGETQEAIDRRVAEADELVYQAALLLAHGRRTDIPVDVVHGQVTMRPPLLFSVENSDGVLLEDLLEQLLTEMAMKQEREPCRETALVITNLEQALLWQLRRGVKRGTAKFELVDPRSAVA
jgi:hypothetical protein